jgi:hypothetical protein
MFKLEMILDSMTQPLIDSIAKNLEVYQTPFLQRPGIVLS